ncbi:MAG: alpha/beta fold hydrolase [Candidatus Binatia bacterium]
MFPLDHGRRLAELLGDARFVAIPGSRAFVPEDEPAALAKAIADFLEQSGRGLKPAASPPR